MRNQALNPYGLDRNLTNSRIRLRLIDGTSRNTVEGTLKGSFSTLAREACSVKNHKKAAKLLSQCGGFTMLSVFLEKQVLDRPGYPGKAWVFLPSTLCTRFGPHE